MLVLLLGGLGLPLAHVFNSRASVLVPEPPDVLAVESSAPSAEQDEGRDFSRFTHSNQTHAALPCLLCHRRESNSPRPALPGHTPCAGCHTQRFNDAGNPICTVCHTDAGSGKLKAFPAMKSFGMRFDHARHLSGGARPASGCVACHRTQRGGVGFSIPAGFAAHSTCFQCHTPQAQAGGRDISSCGTCHAPGRLARTPEAAAAYRVGFSHSKHVGAARLDCSACHNVRAGAPQARQVTAPQALMHHASERAQSCRTCHNDRRAFGIENFANCRRCHQGQHFYF